MISATAKGFRVLLEPEKDYDGFFGFFREARDDYAEIGRFLSDMRHEGIWYAITGQYFTDWLIGIGNTILYYSDALVLVAMGATLFCIFGSKKARSVLYWTIVSYGFIKFLGVLF
jgi:hypothetical protein